VELAGKIAQRASATVTLFHVVAEPPVLLTNLIQKEEDVDLLFRSNTELGRNLRREQEALEQMGVPCTVLLRHGFVIREVCKEVQHGDYDLVVTGLSLNRGALRTYLMGNLTNEIINCAERPVLVVRSAEEPLGIGHDLKELFSEITDVLHHTKEQTR
jgi:nucleotide-binding universal stress UspA family protein